MHVRRSRGIQRHALRERLRRRVADIQHAYGAQHHYDHRQTGHSVRYGTTKEV